MIEKALQYYLQRVPANFLIENLEEIASGEDATFVSWDFQDKIFINILKHPIAVQYPPGNSYTKNFIQRFIDRIENQNQSELEVHDAVMELMGKVFQCSANDDRGHESFILPDGNFISCRVMSRENEVGLRSWDAGLLLAEYCTMAPKKFHGKRIIELGAGIGITGLVCAAATHATEVLLTDYQSRVLSNLHHNVEINKNRLTCPVAVRAFDWGHSDVETLGNFDLLIAADVVYDIDAISLLVRVLSVVLSKRPQASIVIASTVRNEMTYATFLELIRKTGISNCTDITEEVRETVSKPRLFIPSFNSIRVLQINGFL